MQTKSKILALTSLVICSIFAGSCSVDRVKTETMNVPTTASTESVDPELAKLLQQIDKAPDQPHGHTQLAAYYIRLARETGNFELNSKADSAIGRALEIDPKDVSSRKLKASLHLTFHRFDEGLALGKELAAELPNDPFVLGVLTDGNAELGNYPEAVKAAQKMVDLKPNSSSYSRVAHLRSLHGDHKGAVEMYRLAATTADPMDKEAQSWCLTQLGNEYWRNGEFEESEKMFNEALSILPNYPLALAGKGRTKAAQNDLSEAANLLVKANELSAHTHSVILLGDVFTKSGNAARASEQYELAKNGEEKLGDTHDAHRVALFWADNDTNLDEALAIAQADYDTQKDIYAADTLAWCLYKKGRFQEAKAKIKEAMRIGTNDALILYHAGMIEKELGNTRDAKSFLRKALATNPAFDLIQVKMAQQAVNELG